MIDCLSIDETDKVIHTVETDIVKLVVEIESLGISFDEFDKETRSSDRLQPKQADLSYVHALNELHLYEIHVEEECSKTWCSLKIVPVSHCRCSNFDELNEDECFDPGGGKIDVSQNIEDDDSFAFVIRTFFSYRTYPVDPSFTFSLPGVKTPFLTPASPLKASGISSGWNFHVL
ncbi:hypothetical protein Tco_0201591 [Tanacetum coccineum]